MKKKQNLKTLMTIVITAIVTYLVTALWLYGGNREINSVSFLGTAFQSDKLVTKINMINQKIEEEFIGEKTEEEDLIEGAIKGYVSALGDEYTEYYTTKEMDEYYSDTVGEFVGIGVEITKDTENNEIVIYDTIANSPAQAAGLLSKDVLIGVDGVSCNGDDFDTITDSIKGKAGTTVKIKVRRQVEEKEQILEFEIERKNIEMIRVTSQMLENNIGYINIDSFDGVKVSDQFESEYDNLVSQGAKSLIIDVRTNGGGIVDEAVEIGDLLTNKGDTLLIEKNKAGDELITKSKKDKKITMDVVLLTNEYSASASEILAAIVKDLVDNGTIVGNTTYGKGVIQTLYKLTDNSGLKITTEEYFTPNHNEINKKGIEPDVKVEDEKIFTGVLDKENDTSLKKAIEILTNK